MPRLIIAGDPGEVHENETGKVQYQLIVKWSNSCGLCIQYDHQVGSYWPCPFHRNCNCTQVPILPGMAAQPFVDFRAKILTVPPIQQAVIIGKSNLAMVESGLVKWDDVVTPSRIRSLREVVSRRKITVDQMVGSGVTRGRAEEAWNAVHTGTHTASEAARARQTKALLAKGYTKTQIVDAAGRAIGSRIGIVEGPSGPQTVYPPLLLTPRPMPKVALRIAAIPEKVASKPTLAPVKTDSEGRLNFTARAMVEFIRGMVRHLAERFGITYKPKE